MKGRAGILFSNVLLTGIVFVLVMSGEFYGHFLEKGVGQFLKWQNSKRQQLGRLWEKERETVIGQSQVQSVLSSILAREKSGESIASLEAIFENLNPSRVVSREKFLQLYFDYPVRIAERIVGPLDLLQMDAQVKWERVLLSQKDESVRMSFIGPDNFPMHEVTLAPDLLAELRSARNVFRGDLEMAGFRPESVFPIDVFLPVMENLDVATQEALFPEPKWFLKNGYHVRRVGISLALNDARSETSRFGIEYASDFSTEVLLIPLSLAVANNLLSQIESAGLGGKGEAQEHDFFFFNR